MFKFGRQKTLVYNKNEKQQKLCATLRMSMKRTLGGDGGFHDAIKLPEGEDLEEWLAMNTTEIAEAASMVWAQCEEFCTAETCPQMNAGKKASYLWSEGNQKPTVLPACDYIDKMIEWVDGELNDTSIFPVAEEEKFPKDFKKHVSVIIKRIFRLYAHVYFSHFDKLRAQGFEAHLNTCFKHLTFFIMEFELVNPKELTPLRSLIERFTTEEEFFKLMKCERRVFAEGQG